MNSRRKFLQTGLLGASTFALPSSLLPHGVAAEPIARLIASQWLAAEKRDEPPTRFIFLHKGNGLLPNTLVPPTLNDAQKEAERKKETFTVDLDEHDLPNWMAPLSAHKKNLTIIQGLSGKMCTTGHHTWCSSLGVFKANERLSSIKWATVDFELAKLFPSPFGHIELACFPHGGGNSRGNINGIEKGFSARGPQQPNYAFGSPKIALAELFKSVATDASSRANYELEQKVLAFVARNHGSLAKQLIGAEQPKVGNYAKALQDIRERNGGVESMAEVIRKNLPKLDPRYLAEDLSTVDRQAGHTGGIAFGADIGHDECCDVYA